MVGMTKALPPSGEPSGQRWVMVLTLVQNFTPSMPCWLVSPKALRVGGGPGGLGGLGCGNRAVQHGGIAQCDLCLNVARVGIEYRALAGRGHAARAASDEMVNQAHCGILFLIGVLPCV